jgi:hypothetical protein
MSDKNDVTTQTQQAEEDAQDAKIQQNGAAVHDDVKTDGANDTHDNSEAYIASLRRENASWRRKYREAQEQMKSSSASRKQDGDPTDSGDELRHSYEKLARSQSRILLRDLANAKGIDPEILEAVAQKRGIDVLTDDGYEQLDELIKEKKWGRKSVTEFGYSGGQKVPADSAQPKNINDAIGRLFNSK